MGTLIKSQVLYYLSRNFRICNGSKFMESKIMRRDIYPKWVLWLIIAIDFPVLFLIFHLLHSRSTMQIYT